MLLFWPVIKFKEQMPSKTVFYFLRISQPLSACLCAFRLHNFYSPLSQSSGFIALIDQMPKGKFIPIRMCAKSINITFTISKYFFFYLTNQAEKQQLVTILPSQDLFHMQHISKLSHLDVSLAEIVNHTLYPSWLDRLIDYLNALWLQNWSRICKMALNKLITRNCWPRELVH